MKRLKNEHVLFCKYCNTNTIFIPVGLGSNEPCEYCKKNNITCEASECTRCDQLDPGECTRIEKRASNTPCSKCGSLLWNEETATGRCVDCNGI